ncbi:hypothetical protein A3740_14550, partial [Oleiphilus sp. HI0068]
MDEKTNLIVSVDNANAKDITDNVISIDQDDAYFYVQFEGKDRQYKYAKKNKNLAYERILKEFDVSYKLVSIKGARPRKFVSAQQAGEWYRFVPEKGANVVALRRDVSFIKDKRSDERVNKRFEYLKRLSRCFEIKEEGKEPNQYLENYYKNLGGVETESALAKYLAGELGQRFELPKKVLFPFGLNPSQKSAVENALTNQISVIEGPPGTGKTQTILNIIANAVSEGQTVGVVSGNNSATDNVAEKLEANGFGFLTAALGNDGRKTAFFSKEFVEPQKQGWVITTDVLAAKEAHFKMISTKLEEVLVLENELAEIKQKKLDFDLEKQHFESKYPDAKNVYAKLTSRRKYTAADILAFKQSLIFGKKKSKLALIWSAIKVYFRFGISNFKQVSQCSAELISDLEKDYFDTKVIELTESISSLEKKLEGIESKSLMKSSKELSLELFKHSIALNRYGLNPEKFTKEDYRNDYETFLKQHPLILSATHSLRGCVDRGTLLDYLIIDEASQVDLVTAAISLSCCKRLVVVGDLKQISNFASEAALDQKAEVEDEYPVEEHYNFYDNSIMSSLLKTYGDRLPKTMLREHYRCHPAIIGFCNKQFYNDQLLIMTEEGERKDPFLVFPLVAGNHARKLFDEPGLFSEREISVIKDEVLTEPRLATQDSDEIGIIAPYRKHIEQTRKCLDDENMDTDTVFKYQGREKQVIVFSTVANSINDFIDRADTVNVAVSRAVDQFVLVTGNKIFNDNNSNIGALVRYINYQTMGKALIPSKKSSVFDMLYSEQSVQRREFLARHNKVSIYHSENLIDVLLREVLSLEAFQDLDYVLHVQLNDIVKDTSELTYEQSKFVKNPWSHVDFLIYSRIDKSPVLAIEVDGFEFHENNAEQRGRDTLKNQVLQNIGLRLLRLKTNECDEKERIVAALERAAKRQTVSDSQDN